MYFKFPATGAKKKENIPTSISSISFHLLDCLHKCMQNILHKTACTNGLPDDEHMMFETCRWCQEWIKTLIWKVCICCFMFHKCITIHGTKTIKLLSLSCMYRNSINHLLEHSEQEVFTCLFLNTCALIILWAKVFWALKVICHFPLCKNSSDTLGQSSVPTTALKTWKHLSKTFLLISLTLRLRRILLKQKQTPACSLCFNCSF